ncbi:MAG: CHAT domain-containing protein [Rivularia sp. (in: Bacteria)]|nr:CHAT domain-containing protein [Rivularia sp. MS3]
MKKFKSIILIILISLLFTTLSPILTKPTFSNPPQIEHLLDRGKKLYDVGKFEEAIGLLKQAVSRYQLNGDKLNQAVALSNISLAYQKLGQWQKAETNINNSLQLLRNLPKNITYAQSLDVKGKLEFEKGEFQNSIITWEEAAKIYSRLDLQPALTQSLINQAQAMQALGLFIKAQKTLISVRENLDKQPNSVLKSVGLRSIGDVLRIIGNVDESKTVLLQSLDVASTLKANQAKSEALVSLGNTVRVQENIGSQTSAIKYYQEAANIAPINSNLRLQAQLNILNLLVGMENINAAMELISQIRTEIKQLSPNRKSVFICINFAKALKKIKQKTNIETVSWLDIAQVLSNAVKQAEIIKDKRALAYALGNLGQLYEQTEQFDAARKLTQKALNMANSVRAEDISYQFQWQMGRLYRRKGNIKKAIKFYDAAWNILKSLRSDLVAVDSNVQFSFRESIEPVYREYADLLLKTAKNKQPSKQKLIAAREVIESLQLAQIDNFFNSACFNTKVVLDDIVDRQNLKTAIVYPIILPDRLEVILKLPLSSLVSYSNFISQKEVEKTIQKLRTDIEERKIGADNQAEFQKLYSWLLQPAEKYLENSNIETLVFVLDGSLRNIPPAALHDGRKYLIEKYTVAVSPGLQQYELKPLQKTRFNVLTGGLSEERTNFPKLDYVEQELQQIKFHVSDAKILLNEKFTSDAVEKQVNKKTYPIVHLATHGQFSSNSDETFLLAYDGRIKVKELSRWLHDRRENLPQPIELLVLSACETATGDNEAALGLAGVAIQAGARSTVASLWALNDASTAELMNHFYHQLTKPNIAKAQALRHAQLSLLKNEEYSIPYFWAPYVLIGNWL